MLPGFLASAAFLVGCLDVEQNRYWWQQPLQGHPTPAFHTPLWGPLHSGETAAELLLSLISTGRKEATLRSPRSAIELGMGAPESGQGMTSTSLPATWHRSQGTGHVWVHQELGAWEEACSGL